MCSLLSAQEKGMSDRLQGRNRHQTQCLAAGTERRWKAEREGRILSVGTEILKAKKKKDILYAFFFPESLSSMNRQKNSLGNA